MIPDIQGRGVRGDIKKIVGNNNSEQNIEQKSFIPPSYIPPVQGE
jgi:hypothetical protein